LACNITKKLGVNVCSSAHLTLILLLHYFVKYRSHNLATYNNEFILGSTYVGSEMINWIATNASNSYHLWKSSMWYIALFLLQHLLKMFFSTNANGELWCHSPTAHSITRDLELLMRHFSLLTYNIKMDIINV